MPVASVITVQTATQTSDSHHDAAEATTIKPQPAAAAQSSRSRMQLLDWMLLSASLVLMMMICAHLMQTAFFEAHRMHHTPIFNDAQATQLITRRIRAVQQYNPPAATASTDPSASAALVPASRHLLSTAAAPAAASKSEFGPFDSAEHRDQMYKQWEADFQVLSDKHGDAGKAFRDFFGPAVDKLDVHAAPLGSTNYCVAGFDGRENPDLVFTLKNTFHLLGMDPDKQKQTVKNGGVLWSLIMWVSPEVEKCQ